MFFQTLGLLLFAVFGTLATTCSLAESMPNCVFSRTAGDCAVLNQSLLAAAG